MARSPNNDRLFRFMVTDRFLQIIEEEVLGVNFADSQSA